MGPLDPVIMGLLDFGTFEPLLSSTTSSYFLLPPPISPTSYTLSYIILSLPTSSKFGLVWFGYVWFGMEGPSDD